MYPHLFSPLRIGNVTVRNRLMQTGHSKQFARDGVDSRRNLDYQVERARGGVGLVITGNRFVHPTSSAGAPRFAWAFLREAIPGDRRMTDAVHEHGAAIFAQLNHFGVNGSSDNVDDLRVLWGPSPVRSPAYNETPKEMEHADIRELAEWWARSAACSREAGFDGVEVHLAHAYLLHQFLSPLYNQRTDEYGGSLDNRLRIVREVLREVRQATGEDFVVGVRLSLSDLVEGGLDVEDACRIAASLGTTEQIDYVNVSIGGYHDGLALAIAPSDLPGGQLVELTARVKSAVPPIPVFVVGGLSDLAEAEEIVASGKADMVAMTRAQIAEPELANKAREGREDEIYHCIRGNQGCISRSFKGLPIACTVNPAAGREAWLGPHALTPADPPGRWLVAGGGPAGMKAAETLARRGHNVVLVEREERLGGQVNLILKTPGREPFGWITRDLERHLRRLGVEIRLGTEGSLELVRALAPEGVIVATGARPTRDGYSSVNPLVRSIPGAEQENVLTVWDVLLERRPIGEGVAVLDDDGGRYAAGVAEVLLDGGSRVELVSRFNALFPTTLYTLDMPILYERLLGKGLEYRLNTWAKEIRGNALTVYNLFTRNETTLEVDTVVLATGPAADDALYFELQGSVENLHRIGDCLAPRKLDHAIYEGYLAGLERWSPEERYLVEGELERWEPERHEELAV